MESESIGTHIIEGAEKKYLWPRLRKAQGPVALSVHICGVEGRLNWVSLLCLGHGLLEPGRPVLEGARMVTNSLLTRRAELCSLHSLADNLA